MIFETLHFHIYTLFEDDEIKIDNLKPIRLMILWLKIFKSQNLNVFRFDFPIDWLEFKKYRKLC